MSKHQHTKLPPCNGRHGSSAVVVSSTLASTLLGLAGLGITAHAATQQQSQTTATQQSQQVTSSGPASVATTQTYGLQSQQTATDNSFPTQPVVAHKDLTVGTAQISTNNSPQPGQVVQQQSVTSQSQQATATAAPSGPYPLLSSGSSQGGTIGIASHSQRTQVQVTGSPTPEIFAGYRIFDLQEHLLSNNLTNSTTQPDHSAPNFTPFYPGIAVTLVVKAVDTQGNPMPSPFGTLVYLKPTASDCMLSNVGSTSYITSLNVPLGSMGVPFVYTNTGLQANHDAINASLTPPWHKALPGPTVVQHIRLTTMQTTAVSSTSSVQASQTQSSTTQNQQSQQSAPQTLFGVTQSQVATSQQSQSLVAHDSTSGSQSQLARLSGAQLQNQWSTGELKADNTMNLLQAQTQQTTVPTNGSVKASQTQTLSFTATAWMRLFLLQQQRVSSTSVTQSEGMQAMLGYASNAPSNSADLATAVAKTTAAASQSLAQLPAPSATSATPVSATDPTSGGSTDGTSTPSTPANTPQDSLRGTLYVYLNNVLKNVFQTSGGTVATTEQQSANTASPSASSENASVSYVLNGKQVTTAVS
ncbi:hypothetical protein D2Q93_08965 [Alicyclobacillaceae bacterium I2511]|nr:hypothetical protein D2Q93_08965 [Alicyclobacillaceae bacterium I2511]